MKLAKVVQAAERLRYWLDSISDESRELILKFIAAWPGADRLAELYPDVGQFGWLELRAIFDLYQVVDTSEDMEDAVDTLLDGVDDDIAAALDLIPSAIADSNEGAAVIWKKDDQADGVAAIWLPGESVRRYSCERQWEQTSRKTEEFRYCAWTAAETLLQEQGLAADEVEEVLESALWFRGRKA